MPDLTPSCPRCGYDLTGAQASRPPEATTGICSECGLAFAWQDVLDPARLHLRGFVEHAQGFCQTLWWSWRTFFGSFLASRFWRRVRLEYPPRPGKWAVYPLATAGVCWLAARLLWFIAWFGHAAGPVPPVKQGGRYYELFSLERLLCRVWSVDMHSGSWPPTALRFTPDQALPPAALGALAAVAMMPLMLLALPFTRARLKIRRTHVARAGVFGALPVLTALALLGLADAYQAVNQMTAGFPFPPWANSLGRAWNNLTYTLNRYQVVLGLGAIFWLFWWWAEALRTGFRVSRWGPILAAQWSAALLAAAIIVLLHPYSHRYLLDWLT